ncbi:MAG: cysteine hydrolase [Anaerolineaceae bacterium]|nr:cysteine hydrolase [Anaerolineaceae bacterium]
MNPRQVLIIIDAQVNMFDENFSIFDSDRIINVLSSLIDKAHEKNVPVIYVRNNGDDGEPDQPGTPGWEIHPSIKPQVDDIVIDKQGPDAFHNTDLAKVLKKQGITDLVIAGMQTEMCVETSSRRAVELGYDVILVEDGHSTFNFDDLNAENEISRVNREIKAIAKIVKADNIEF